MKKRQEWKKRMPLTPESLEQRRPPGLIPPNRPHKQTRPNFPSTSFGLYIPIWGFSFRLQNNPIFKVSHVRFQCYSSLCMSSLRWGVCFLNRRKKFQWVFVGLLGIFSVHGTPVKRRDIGFNILIIQFSIVIVPMEKTLHFNFSSLWLISRAAFVGCPWLWFDRFCYWVVIFRKWYLLVYYVTSFLHFTSKNNGKKMQERKKDRRGKKKTKNQNLVLRRDFWGIFNIQFTSIVNKSEQKNKFTILSLYTTPVLIAKNTIVLLH